MPQQRVPLDIPCAVPDCERTGKLRRGYCGMHYQRLKATGHFVVVPKHRITGGPCSVDGCVRPVHAIGYCGMHGLRVRKHGHPGPPGRLLAPRGSGTTTREGYRQIYVDGTKHLEHRHVMQQMLGRTLRADENVHHINGRRDDNRPENLELWVSGQPAGQRVADLVAFVVDTYPELVSEQMKAKP